MKKILAKIWKALRLPKNLQLFVMRLLHQQFLIGVTGIILNERREVLLVKHSYRQHAWSLPGGYMKSGEHPGEALEREIKEETGLVVSADKLLKTRTDRTSSRVDICYVGVLIGGEFAPSAEVKAHGFFTQDKLPLLRQNQIFLIDQVLQQKKTKKKTSLRNGRLDVK